MEFCCGGPKFCGARMIFSPLGSCHFQFLETNNRLDKMLPYFVLHSSHKATEEVCSHHKNTCIKTQRDNKSSITFSRRNELRLIFYSTVRCLKKKQPKLKQIYAMTFTSIISKSVTSMKHNCKWRAQEGETLSNPHTHWHNQHHTDTFWCRQGFNRVHFDEGRLEPSSTDQN